MFSYTARTKKRRTGEPTQLVQVYRRPCCRHAPYQNNTSLTAQLCKSDNTVPRHAHAVNTIMTTAQRDNSLFTWELINTLIYQHNVMKTVLLHNMQCVYVLLRGPLTGSDIIFNRTILVSMQQHKNIKIYICCI